jgi:hypothetical protein
MLTAPLYFISRRLRRCSQILSGFILENYFADFLKGLKKKICEFHNNTALTPLLILRVSAQSAGNKTYFLLILNVCTIASSFDTCSI